jgi:hypothetical protein
LLYSQQVSWPYAGTGYGVRLYGYYGSILVVWPPYMQGARGQAKPRWLVRCQLGKRHTMRYPTRPTAAMLALASVTCVIGSATENGGSWSDNTYGLANDTVVTGMCVGNSNSSEDVICSPTFVTRPNKTGAPASITWRPLPPPPLLGATRCGAWTPQLTSAAVPWVSTPRRQ